MKRQYLPLLCCLGLALPIRVAPAQSPTTLPISGRAVSESEIVLSWPPIRNADRLEVWSRNQNWPLATLRPTALSYIVGDLAPNQTVSVFLRAWFGRRNVDSSPLTSRSLGIPSDFGVLHTPQGGVAVYRKQSSNTFVTVVDLSRATAMNLTGAFPFGPGMNDVWVDKKGMFDYQSDAYMRGRPRVIINGTFFDKNRDPTPIPFGLKVRGYTISHGSDQEFPGQTRTFSFDSRAGRAWVDPYRRWNFDGSAPDVVGALDPAADKDHHLGPITVDRLGRTFIGARDADGDGTRQTMIILSSDATTRSTASTDMSHFGVDGAQQAMLDGDGSTFLIVDDYPLIQTDRRVPHAIAIFSGK